MARVTERQLEEVVKQINQAAGTPLEPYAQEDATGLRKAQVGNYHLRGNISGTELCQIVNETGGTRQVFGYYNRPTMLDMLRAYLNGLGDHRKGVDHAQ